MNVPEAVVAIRAQLTAAGLTVVSQASVQHANSPTAISVAFTGHTVTPYALGGRNRNTVTMAVRYRFPQAQKSLGNEDERLMAMERIVNAIHDGGDLFHTRVTGSRADGDFTDVFLQTEFYHG